ncbi:MAG TPA: SDR family oxidoreductase, partial [Spongiibacteraceae bacterium]|nr:SDR family oxidoreductase [Spongiibacteraceae bacterium]
RALSTLIINLSGTFVMAQLNVDLSGKTALVTGGTNGIGKAAAIALARMGAEVVIVGRNRALAESTVAEIKRSTGNQKVDHLVADLSVQAEVRKVAADFLNSGRPLHILLNNAGAMFPQRVESIDGIEMTFALNHLGYFLLTELLLDRLRQSAPARIVNVASMAHKGARNGMNFDDLEGRKSYAAFGAYGQSKLANILFTRELARRLQGSNITVNCLHPGFVATRFAHANAIYNIAMTLMRPFQRSIAKGSQTSIYLCAAPEVANISGEYFADCKVATPTPYGRDDNAAKKLWDISEQMVALK